MFITLEGGEGSGKTSLLLQLAAHFRSRGKEVVTTREPGGCLLAERVRALVLEEKAGVPISPLAELLLFLSARAQHIHEVILPALEAGKIVLCDRFHDSTLAYQGVGRALGLEEVRELCDKASQGLWPDRTFFLDVPPHLGLARARGVNKKEAASGEGDRIESAGLAFHEQVRQAFLQLAQAEPDRACVLDGSQSQQEVLAAALGAL